jgi:hypothetical protein
VQVVIEAIMKSLHLPVQLILAGMRKRRMADIMNQRQRFRQIFIEPERTSRRTGNLRHFNGVRQPIAEVIGKARCEDLRLVFQPPERTCMHNTIPVTLKLISVAVG